MTDQPLDPTFLKNLVEDLSVKNPHLKFRDEDHERVRQIIRNQENAKTWRVWVPADLWSYYMHAKAKLAPVGTTNAEFVELLLLWHHQNGTYESSFERIPAPPTFNKPKERTLNSSASSLLISDLVAQQFVSILLFYLQNSI